ncbi:hypothetical protein ACWFMI_06735 [Nocardiopsis terrae]
MSPEPMDDEPTIHHLAETAVRAAALITRSRPPARPDGSIGPRPPYDGAEGEAREWMRTNGEALASCVRWAGTEERHTTVLWVVEAVESHLRDSGLPTERLEMVETGVRAALALGDTSWEARMRNFLALALLDIGELERAGQESTAAHALAEADRDDRARAAALECMGAVAQHDRRDEAALALFESARPLREAMGGPREIAVLDLLSGRSLVSLGRFDHALERLDAALEAFTAPRDGRDADGMDVARVRLERGRALNGKRRTAQARRELERALSGFESGGHTYQTAKVREVLAGVDQLSGAQDWREHLVVAVRLYRGIGHGAEAERVGAHLR